MIEVSVATLVPKLVTIIWRRKDSDHTTTRLDLVPFVFHLMRSLQTPPARRI